jgi:signal transduction histidine kinase/CheY-like chemotaxis protein
MTQEIWQLIADLLRARDWREMGYRLAEHLKTLVPFDRLTFALVDPKAGLAEVLVTEGEVEGLPRTGNFIPLEGTATGWVVRHRAPLFETERQYQTPQFEQALKAGFRSRFAMPVEVDGQILAVLVFHSRQPNAYNLDHAQWLKPFIPLIALALQQLLERWELENALKRLELLRHLDNLLLSGQPMAQVLQGFAQALRPFVPFDRLSLSVYDPATNREWLYVVWHDQPTWEAREVLPFVSFGMAKKVMETGEPLLRPRLDAAEFPAEAWLIEQGFRSSLVFPLPMKGNFKATLNFTSRQANRFDQSHLAFLQGIAEQIALALHALLTEQTQQERERRLINLLRISASLLWTHSVDEIARTLDEGVRKLEASPHFSLFIRFPDGTVQEAINTPEGVQWQQLSWLPQPLKPNETILGDILLGLRAVFVSNDPLREVSELERRQWEQVLGGQVFPFGNAVVPMQGHTGVVGAIAIDFRETRRFLSLHDEIVQLLIMLGNLAGLALENLWLQKQVEQQLAEVRLLNDLILQASAGVDWREMAQSLVNALPQVLPCDTVSVSLLSDDGKFLELVAAYPAPPPQVPLGFRLPIEKGIMGYVARTGEPVLERDVRTNPYYFAGREETLSELCVPIKRGDLVIGVINLESNRLGAFHEGHLAFLQTLAAQLSSVMERAQLLRRQSELLQQLTAIFDSVQEGIVLVLPDGRLDDMNRRFGDLLGIPAEQLRYQPVETLRQALMRRAADPPAMLEAINAALADLNQPQYDLLTLTDPDQLLERYCVPVRLEDGTLMGQLWVLRDVTEEYRRQQESLRLERLRTLGELASGIAHDLNNALAPLLGGAELLRGHPDPEVNSIAESMLNMIHYAVGVVRRLQAFYRQTTAVALTTTEVSALLQDAIALTRSRWRDEALAEGVQIRLDTEFIEGLQVRGDVTALRQAFINILLNAADAIMERAKLTGDRQGTIALRMERIGNQVLVHITDDGIGMPEEVQRRVFETFFTTKGERGSGLGMSMALAAVVAHGGQISLQSEPMKGTTVTVTLPLHTAPPPTPTQAPTPPPLPSLRILVVEDQPPVLQTVVTQLERLGQKVLTASDGWTALDILRREQVDLLITDLSMPSMNGIELARRVREFLPTLPIVLMTGWGEIIPREDLSAYGIRRVLTKPVTLQTWRDTLLQVAGLRPDDPELPIR